LTTFSCHFPGNDRLGFAAASAKTERSGYACPGPDAVATIRYRVAFTMASIQSPEQWLPSSGHAHRRPRNVTADTPISVRNGNNQSRFSAIFRPDFWGQYSRQRAPRPGSDRLRGRDTSRNIDPTGPLGTVDTQSQAQKHHDPAHGSLRLDRGACGC